MNRAVRSCVVSNPTSAFEHGSGRTKGLLLWLPKYRRPSGAFHPPVTSADFIELIVYEYSLIITPSTFLSCFPHHPLASLRLFSLALVRCTDGVVSTTMYRRREQDLLGEVEKEAEEQAQVHLRTLSSVALGMVVLVRAAAIWSIDSFLDLVFLYLSPDSVSVARSLPACRRIEFSYHVAPAPIFCSPLVNKQCTG